MLKVVAGMSVVAGVESAKEYKDHVERIRREDLRAKPLNGKFFRSVSEVSDEHTWQWLSGGYLTKAPVGFILAAQEQAMRTRWVRPTIDGEADVDPKCRVCGKYLETLMHLASGCGELAKKQYLIRHDGMGKRVHWELCRKYGIECARNWYDHVSSSICSTKDGDIEIYWDRRVETVRECEHNRSDAVLIKKSVIKWTL
jgi:hypothetical protein